jgi:hypothetical protein
MRHYNITRVDRAAIGPLRVGQLVWPGNDMYSLASDDTRAEGFEYKAYSLNKSGEPCFTIPAADVEPSPPWGYCGVGT